MSISEDVVAVGDYPFKDDVGSFHRVVTCLNPDVNVWYTRGLVWCWAFHHEEAIYCWQQALKLEPDCPMLHWAIAYAHGPNYNVHVGQGYLELSTTDDFPSLKAAAHHAEKASSLAQENANLTDIERALIGALPSRYAWPGGDKQDYEKRNVAYSDAMRDVAATFRENVDVQALFAESLMDIMPWELFDHKTYAEVPQVAEIRTTIETARTLDPDHPGLNHLLIHFMEMSPTPERALPACDSLFPSSSSSDRAPFCPGLPHLLHMPSHIYVLVGNYGAAIRSNAAAVKANDKVYTVAHSGTGFYKGYAGHDYHMLIYSAMLAGAESDAREYGKKLKAFLPYEDMQLSWMAEGLESYVAVEPHILIRFGRWEEILELPLPEDVSVYVATTATIHYAKTVALAALGRVAEAEVEEALFLKATSVMEGEEPVIRTLHNNTVVDMLAVGKKLARGEILYRKGRQAQEAEASAGAADIAQAFEELRAAAELEDCLVYDEPWGWMVPVRHALGGLMLEQERADEAAAVFRSDLTGVDGDAACCGSAKKNGRHNRHPENIWSLVGLTDCFAKGAERKGARESPESMEERVRSAKASADVVIRASCACVRSQPLPENI
eukprot:TRINITY_DN16974_c0_g1_i1.p1 TRINITY_DN16974_c0_g1~~TRINITY_DN16974_c0_g1_i1.p1  ORF type:complete len:645 (+),score=124.50 TRINITY_DN16974_c0_g1_i1:107-1936(+)